MAMRANKRIIFGAFLLGTTALVAPAAAQTFDNQVNATALKATNTGNVLAPATFNTPQSIAPVTGNNTGIGNNIGAGATGAAGIANVNQTISQSNVQQGALVQGGNAVTVKNISATNSPTTAPASTATANVQATVSISGFSIIGTASNAPITVTGVGISNNIGANANGAAAAASILQSFDTNPAVNFNTLASNQVKAGNVTATNALGSVDASLSPGQFAAIGGGIANSISAQAGGASASASISSRILDTTSGAGSPVIATNTVKTGDIAATSRGSVTATYGNPQALVSDSTALIFNGSGNAIGAIASGASANAGISELIAFSTLASLPGGPSLVLNGVYGNSVTVGSLTALYGKDGTVTATLGTPNQVNPQQPIPVFGATIGNGIGNSIAAQAYGANAGGAINQRFDNVTTSSAGLPLALAASNSVTTDAISAVNRGNITANAAIAPGSALGSPTAAAALISTGIANSIGATASGASAGLGITQAISNSTLLPSGPVDNTAKATGTISAVNHGDIQASAFVLSGGTPTFAAALISGGIGNWIGATAFGASASLGVTQSISNSTLINAGLNDNTAKLNAEGGLTARDGKGATVSAALLDNGATSIANGAGNNIGASAVGASTGATVSQSLFGTVTDGTSLGSNTVIVKDTGSGQAMVARTNANSSVTASFGTFTAPASGAATISDGLANSISAQAAGATVNAGITTRFDNSNVIVAGAAPTLPVNSVDTTAGSATGLLAHNNGAVTASFLFSQPGDLTITSGVANNIGASAVGASASAGISQSVSYEGFITTTPPGGPVVIDRNIATLSLPVNSVKTGDITAKNDGVVTSTLLTPGNATIGTSPALQPGGPGAIGSSIAAQSMGASAQASISSRFYNATSEPSAGGLTTPATNTVKSGDLTATSSNAITANATIGAPVPTGLANASIFGGVGNFIGAMAAGASAGAGITQSVSALLPQAQFDLTQLPSNFVTAGKVSATNNSTVNATLTVTGGISQIGPSGAPISFSAGNVGNSISAQASGASAAASISTQVFNTTIPQSTTVPVITAANKVQVASLSSVNNAPVTATASFNGSIGSFGPIASINGGVGNAIGASATGASSAAGINQIVSTASTVPVGGSGISSLNTLAANTINVGSITAVNNSNITATLSTTGGGFNGANIVGGVGNSITANAVGAFAGASISQSIANSR